MRSDGAQCPSEEGMYLEQRPLIHVYKGEGRVNGHSCQGVDRLGGGGGDNLVLAYCFYFLEAYNAWLSAEMED